MEFFGTVDLVICLVVGAVAGLLAHPIVKPRGFGPIGSGLVGLVGGGVSGWLFDLGDFMQIGDVLDPVIAGLVGAIVLVAIVGAVKR
jgi:uncharacterized membrane protein YeaQ/YmgE (transglycosylase-associated protein family)